MTTQWPSGRASGPVFQPDPGSQPRIAYLGWAGFANLGDEAVMEAVGQALPDVHLDQLPLGPRSVGAAVAHGDARRWSECHLVVGGGTVLGRRIWRVHLTAGMLLARSRPLLMIGAGVEDPAFPRDHWLSEGRELRHWPRLLRHFDRVTVRGPRSADLLASVGVPAEVVGDPALLLTGPKRPEPAGIMGVNLGCQDDLWGHDQANVVRVVAMAVSQLARHVDRIRFLVVNPNDRADAERCAALAALPPGGYDIFDTHQPATFLPAVADCAVLLCERLHAGVLGAAAGVPVVMLEYQPKCRDFMASIDAGARIARTDNLAATRCVELVLATLERASEIGAVQDQSVARLRSLLRREASRISEVISGAAT